MRVSGVVLVALLAAGCATFGGPPSVPVTGLVFGADSPSADAVANRIRAENADVVLISAGHDAAWFEQLAGATRMHLSGPGDTGERRLGFLTRMEALGDTSIVLPVEGGRLYMHDALYRVGGRRTLDLMYVRIEAGVAPEDAATTLLRYLASDVDATAAVLLAIEAPSPATVDVVAQRMRAYLSTAQECADGSGAAFSPNVRVLYGPTVRLGCAAAEVPAAAAEPTVMRLRVGG
jgi:hypothetical protein